MVGERHIRNIGAISEAEQERLGASRVLIVGCGGLGGTVFSHLLRIGVGHITIVDGDSFDATNLNRQLLCTAETVGMPKVAAAAELAAKTDTGVQVRAVHSRFDENNAAELTAGHDVVIDALDNVPSRRILAAACEKAGLPLVYGAISGFVAQVSVLMPDRAVEIIERLYPDGASAGGKSCLSFTPGVCAGIQAAEAVKLLLKKPTELDGKLLYIDLLFNEWQYTEI